MCFFKEVKRSPSIVELHCWGVCLTKSLQNDTVSSLFQHLIFPASKLHTLFFLSMLYVIVRYSGESVERVKIQLSHNKKSLKFGYPYILES